MQFPTYANKHLEESLFVADDFIKYHKVSKKGFPKKIILIYNKGAYGYFKRKYSGKYKTLKVHTLVIHKIGNLGVIKVNGIGAPHAVTYLEELISLGAREVINIGTAGGLQKEGVFLCDRAIRDEGTSFHYIEPSKYSYPDDGLTKKLGKCLEKNGVDYSIGASWTIDAPYRETKVEVEHYRKEGVVSVEMEASALFAVAKVRKIKIDSAFVVSDILGKKWEPNFHRMDVKKALNKLLDVSMECLSK